MTGIPTDRKEPDLDDAYGLTSPADNVRLYGDWAATYDAGFAGPQEYHLPNLVSDAFAGLGGAGPVLDLGAGTGLVAERLAQHGLGPVDGIDISDAMLGVAAEKRVYRRLFNADITQGLPDDLRGYAGLVSSGTFTLGHVGPAALLTLLEAGLPGALVVFSVNQAHFAAAGFKAVLDGLDVPYALDDVAIYGAAADHAHRNDRAFIVSFRLVA